MTAKHLIVVFAFIVTWKAHWRETVPCKRHNVDSYTGEADLGMVLSVYCSEPKEKDMSQRFERLEVAQEFLDGCPDASLFGTYCTDKVISEIIPIPIKTP